MQSTRHMIIFLAFLILFYASFGLIVYWQLSHFAMLVDAIHDHPLAVAKSTLTASRNVVRISRNVKDMLLVPDLAHRQRRLMEIEQDEHDTEQNINIVLARISGEDGRVLVRKAIEMIHTQKKLRERITTDIFSGDPREGEMLARTQGIPLMKELEEIMSKIANYADTQALAYHIESVTTLKRAKVVLLSAGLIVVILSLTFAVVAWRSLRKSLRKSRLTLHEASKGPINLAAVFDTPSPGQIGEGLNTFFHQISALIGALKKNQQELANKLAAISRANEEMPISFDEVVNQLHAVMDKLASLLDVNSGQRTFRLPFSLLIQIKTDIGLLAQIAATKDLLIEKIKIEKDPAAINEAIETIRVHSKSMKENFDRTISSLDSVMELFSMLLIKLNELRTMTVNNQDAFKDLELLKENARFTEEIGRDIKEISLHMGETLKKFRVPNIESEEDRAQSSSPKRRRSS